MKSRQKPLIGQTLGIVGGGQLAKMLAASAQKMGLKVSIYSESKSDPAALTTAFHTKGKASNKTALSAWSKTVDAVTFESEFLDFTGLKIKNHAPSGKCMMRVRDRLAQKNLLKDFNIPTSPFSVVDLKYTFKSPVVMKQRLFGYDGYGTKICKTKKNLTAFLKDQQKLDDWIAEDFIPFKRELAFSVVRNNDNEFTTLPLVETFQKDSKCFWVKGPIENKKLSAVVKKVKTMMTGVGYVGILAVELFETKEGALLVNELAPRVHNSAHYSIEGLPLSQFDLHVMAVFNQSLPKAVTPHKAFAMVNLIGTSKRKPIITNPLRGSLHWYSKTDNRPGRKMGHVTVLDKSANSALKLVLKEETRQKL